MNNTNNNLLTLVLIVILACIPVIGWAALCLWFGFEYIKFIAKVLNVLFFAISKFCEVMHESFIYVAKKILFFKISFPNPFYKGASNEK